MIKISGIHSGEHEFSKVVLAGQRPDGKIRCGIEGDVVTVIALLANLMFKVCDDIAISPEKLLEIMLRADGLAKEDKLKELFPNSSGPENEEKRTF